MTRTLDDLVHEDVWDSRDAIERIDVLEAILRDDDETPADNLAGRLDPEDYSELLAWRQFMDCGYLPDDWQYGETFIADGYFKSYAMELADELGAIPTDYSWPTSCIDWDQAARELRMDYTSYELAGHTFWGSIMSAVHIRMVEDPHSDLVDLEYFHHEHAPEDVPGWPAPESVDYPVHCHDCGGRIEEVPLTAEGRLEYGELEPYGLTPLQRAASLIVEARS